ncbi:MAG: short-chain dehydrogenase/reductase [Mucilaginibacter sp.]|uniref:SDR family oxidoreductase n=1 Tax=Mucilaginibacter sp. TaxID=1882438 RepID=UPI0026180E98|nr:SDR family NAD(P)-dependent oxidoreductase [Mucilaginibacter sp.]MDB5004534.1 short-chain dehydrogenase/reductase [Mucilaginibacter sp.]
MNITNKTVLITGGGSGIGLEIAKQLSAKNNKVIITGRTADKLQKAAEGLANVTAIATDVTNADNVKQLVATIKSDFGGLDILINNAGHTYVYNLDASANAAEKAREEFDTNFFSILNLTEQLLPALTASPEAAIVNVSSILALTPRHTLPTYSASKAALHSYTQALRFALKATNVKVFELMPPLVNTEFSKEIGGENGIPPSTVADDLINAFEKDEYEIHVGNTAHVYGLSPVDAFKMVNEG